MAEGLRDTAAKEILKYKPVKYLITGLLSIFTLSLIYFFGQHIYRCNNNLNSKFLWGASECSECKQITIDSITKHDTVPVYKDRVVYLQAPTKSANGKPSVSQKIDSGGSGVQADKISGGNVAGRDININSEKKLNEEELVGVVTEIKKRMKEYNFTEPRIFLNLVVGSNGAKVYSQLQNYLPTKGFIIISSGQTGTPNIPNGIMYSKGPPIDGNCIAVLVGMF